MSQQEKRENEDDPGRIFFLPGHSDPDREHEFRPMTMQEVAATNAKYQEGLYRKMHKDFPEYLGNISDFSDSEDESAKSDIPHQSARKSSGESSRRNNLRTDELNSNYLHTNLQSEEELKLLLDVRNREIKRINEESDIMKTSLQRQINQLEAELRQVSKEKIDATDLLEETKSLLNTKSNESKQLAEQLAEVKKQNGKLLTDLEFSKLSCQDLQKNLLLMERGSRDKVELLQLERRFEEIEERHKKELKQVEDELIESAKKCKALEMENLELVNKIRQLTKDNEELTIENAESVKRMAKEVDSLRNQLTGGSVIQLQLEVAKRTAKEEELQSQLRVLQMRYDNTLEELQLLRVASTEVTPRAHDGTSSLLHSELLRVCSESKGYRAEISKLEAILHEKEALERTQSNELALTRRLLAEREAHIDRLDERLKEEISKRVEDANVSLSDDQKVTEINEENEKLRNQVEVLEQNLHKLSFEANQRPDIETLNRYNQEYLKFHENEMNTLRKKMLQKLETETQSRDAVIENLRAEVDGVKNEFLKLKEIEKSSSTKLQCQQEEMSNLRKEIEQKHASFDSPSAKIVNELQLELEASRKRVLALSKSVIEHNHQDVSGNEALIKALTGEKEKLEFDLKTSEAAAMGLRSQIGESQDAVVALHAKLSQMEEERLTIIYSYDKQLQMLRDELEAKNMEAHKKISALEQQASKEGPVVLDAATSPTGTKYFSEQELKGRLEILAEVHEKELRDLELQYSLSMAKLIQQLRPVVNGITETKATSEAATNTEAGGPSPPEHVNREVTARIQQYKMALDVAMKECEDLRRRLLEEGVDSATEIRRLTEKHENYKAKVRRYKAHLNEALRRIQSEFDRERDRYNRTLDEIQKEVGALKRIKHDTFTSAQVETFAKLYDEKIDIVKKLLQQYETKKPLP